MPFGMQSESYSNSCEITTFDINELLGRKLSAIHGRKKSRDLFDLWHIMNNPGQNDVTKQKIVACAQDYRIKTKERYDDLVCRGWNKNKIKIFNVRPITFNKLENVLLSRKIDSIYCNALGEEKLLHPDISFDACDAIDWVLETFTADILDFQE